MKDTKPLYTAAEHAMNVLQAKASRARRLAHGADLRAYQDALADIGRAYLKAHPSKTPGTRGDSHP
jgi:hypothetical protein